MGKCCICGKEATYLIHGMWWCKNHRNLADEKSESEKPSRIRENPSSSKDLGLKWI